MIIAYLAEAVGTSVQCNSKHTYGYVVRIVHLRIHTCTHPTLFAPSYTSYNRVCPLLLSLTHTNREVDKERERERLSSTSNSMLVKGVNFLLFPSQVFMHFVSSSLSLSYYYYCSEPSILD